MPVMIQKVCLSCKATKLRAEFHRNSRRKDGLCSICKTCACDKAKGWFKQNLERAKESRSAYYRANLTEVKQIQRSYRINNSAKVSAGEKRWREQNKDRVRQNARKWKAANPEKSRLFKRVNRHRRRASIATSSEQHTAADVHKLYVLQKGKCVCCMASLSEGYQVDHIHPLSRGGHNGRKNIQLLCPPCNRRKSAKDPIQFMQESGFLL